MHDLKRVQEPNPDYDLLGDLGGVVLFQHPLLLDKLEKILPVDQFHDDVDVRLGLDAFFELEQQGVGDDLHDATLVAVLERKYAMRLRACWSSLYVSITLIA